MVFQNKKYIYIAVFAILILASGVDFFLSLKKDNFFRLKFDLDQTEFLQKENYQLISFEHNSLRLKGPKNTLQPNTTYALELAANQEKYYFAFSDKKTNKNSILLTGLVWYFNMPLPTENNKISITQVALKENKTGKLKVAMLTEQLGCCLIFGKKLRYLWNKENEEVNFIGNKKDVYNYKYYGAKNIKSIGIARLLKEVAPADVYVIWTGRNETNTKAFITNIKNSLASLKQKQPAAKIILMYPAPSPVKEIDKNIVENVEALKKENFNGITSINLYKKIKEKKNWKSEYFKYDYALSEKAYTFIVKCLEDAI